MHLFFRALPILVIGLFSINSSSKNYYVDPQLSNNSGNGSYERPFKLVQSGIAQLNPGDTLILRDGIYQNPEDALIDLPNGSAEGYITIKAEHDGKAILDIAASKKITSSFNIENNAYLQIEGLKVITQGTMYEKGIYNSHHIKILRTAFEGGPANSNTAGFSIARGSHHVLIEDSWFYGSGGRMNLLIYEAEKIIVRRVLIRHDHGWSNIHKAEPEGGSSVYNSSNVLVQNLFVIDGSPNPLNKGSEYTGAMTLANNGYNNALCRDNTIQGAIVLDVQGNAFDHGGWATIENAQFNDILAWWTGPTRNHGGAISHSNQSFKNTIAKRITIGNYEYAAAIWGGENSEIQFNQSIIYNTKFSFGGNGGEQGKIITKDNLCLKARCDLPDNKVASFSSKQLSLAINQIRANQAEPVGAHLRYKLGKSGTLWGEQGFDQIQDENLWPWQNQQRIKQDLVSARHLPPSSPAKRGFTASELSLTDYLWEKVLTFQPTSAATSQIH